MSTYLWFDLAGVLRLADHAVNATAHRRLPWETDAHGPCPGGLVWTTADGIWLSSTGLPVGPHDPAGGDLVVYAEGWGPGCPRAARAGTDIGGDDDIQHLHLRVAYLNGDTLHERLLRGAASGARYLMMILSPGGGVDLGTTRRGPWDR